MKKLESGVLKMGEPCYNCKCSAYSTKDSIAGKYDFSPDCGDFVGFDCATVSNSNRPINLPCYNDNCYVLSKTRKMAGCVFSDTCPNFMAVGFGSAKKKTNFDHIKEMSVDEFVNMVAKQACPPGSGNCEPVRDLPCKTCQSCWKSWLESEYHD